MKPDDKKNSVEDLLNTKQVGIVKEFFEFLTTNKAYWLAPILIVFILLAGLIMITYATGGAAAPFIYTLF